MILAAIESGRFAALRGKEEKKNGGLKGEATAPLDLEP